jgi:L-fuculose-phosphate aldolase
MRGIERRLIMATLSYLDQREQIVEAMDILFQVGVMSHSGHANASVRLPGAEDQMLLTSGGIMRDLTPDQLAVVTFAGEVLEGELPSVAREIVAMHAVVYRERPEAGAVIHTHSPHVTSFALAHRPLPCAYEALLRFGVTEDIPVAAWAPRGSQESASYIAEQLRAHPYAPAVLLANHGLLAFGSSATAAAYLIVAMEEAAEMTLAAEPIGGARGFPPGALEKERAHMARFGSAR